VNRLKTITIRSGSGTPQRTVEVVNKATVGFRTTHNGDGRFTYAVAVDADGNLYETCSHKGWRPLVHRQRSAQARIKLSEGGSA